MNKPLTPQQQVAFAALADWRKHTRAQRRELDLASLEEALLDACEGDYVVWFQLWLEAIGSIAQIQKDNAAE